MSRLLVFGWTPTPLRSGLPPARGTPLGSLAALGKWGAQGVGQGCPGGRAQGVPGTHFRPVGWPHRVLFSRTAAVAAAGAPRVPRGGIPAPARRPGVRASGAVYAVDNGLSDSPRQIRFRRVRIARTMEESAGRTRLRKEAGDECEGGRLPSGQGH